MLAPSLSVPSFDLSMILNLVNTVSLYRATLCSPFQLGRGKLLAPAQLLNLVVPCALSCTASIGMDPRGVAYWLPCLPVSFRLTHRQLAPFTITISRVKQFLCLVFGFVSPSSRPRRIIKSYLLSFLASAVFRLNLIC